MIVYGELGAIPLDVDIKSRMLTFWTRLCSGEKHKISNTIYSLLYTLDEKKNLSLNGWKLLRQRWTIADFLDYGWINHCLALSKYSNIQWR